MASLKARVFAAVTRWRRRYPWLDHTLRMVQHYNAVYGNGQAGAVTYFGFLSFFPILALARARSAWTPSGPTPAGPAWSGSLACCTPGSAGCRGCDRSSR